MSELKVSFKKLLIFREENNSVFLFNKNNSAVLKISNALYEKISEGRVLNEARYTKALKTLHENDMVLIDPWEDSLKVNGGAKVVKKEELNANLFGINSDKNPIVVLWSITPKCNLKCTYCFPEVSRVCSSFSGLEVGQLKKIASQIITAKVFQLTISGGEAFLTEDLWQIIPVLYESNIKISVITNGTAITDSIIKRVLQFELIVGVSLDAPNEQINSITRGEGVFVKTLNGIKKLLTANVPTVVLMTLTRHNFPVLIEHVRFLYELGIRNITLQDLRPFGTKEIYDHFRLTKEQEAKLYCTIKTIKKTFPSINFNLSELFVFPCQERKMKRNGKIMQCPAGDNFAYIDCYGDMYPCTNLTHINLGNVLRDGSITDLWQNSTGIHELRALKKKSVRDLPGCADCSWIEYCDGGCRGDALFYTGDMLSYPSRCPKAMGVCDEH